MALLKKTKKETKAPAAAAPAEPATSLAETRSGLRASRIRHILQQPHLSEKAHRLGVHGQYAFLVDDAATKRMVAEEVAARYGVRVTAVTIVRKHSRAKRWRNVSGVRPVVKKAFVTLAKGQTIDHGV